MKNKVSKILKEAFTSNNLCTNEEQVISSFNQNDLMLYDYRNQEETLEIAFAESLYRVSANINSIDNVIVVNKKNNTISIFTYKVLELKGKYLISNQLTEEHEIFNTKVLCIDDLIL